MQISFDLTHLLKIFIAGMAAVIFFLVDCPAKGEETCLFGTVESVDHEAGIFVLRVDHPAGEYAAGQEISIQAEKGGMPEDLTPGEAVRVRLSGPETPDGLPRAHRIVSPSRFTCGKDRTGVRERIMRGASPQWHENGGMQGGGFGRGGSGHGGRHGR